MMPPVSANSSASWDTGVRPLFFGVSQPAEASNSQRRSLRTERHRYPYARTGRCRRCWLGCTETGSKLRRWISLGDVGVASPALRPRLSMIAAFHDLFMGVARWLDGPLTGIVVKSGAGSSPAPRWISDAALHFVAEDQQLPLDGLAQYVGPCRSCADQALHLAWWMGIRLIVQRLVDLGRDADQRGLEARFFVGGMASLVFTCPSYVLV